jgi:hypothetical protein
MDELPDEAQLILELYGIDNVHEWTNKTIH